nr:MAG TPA: hypothetical protein [Caudoviricetes sp.]
MKNAKLTEECKLIMTTTLIHFKKQEEYLHDIEALSLIEIFNSVSDKTSINKLIEDAEQEIQLVNETLMNFLNKNIKKYF